MTNTYNNKDAGKNSIPVNKVGKKYLQLDEALKGKVEQRTGDWKTRWKHGAHSIKAQAKKR